MELEVTSWQVEVEF